jgi:hypothetical protein
MPMADAEDVILTGPPRSGTTLTCHLLNKLADVVALSEPMRVEKLAKLPDRAAACEEIAAFFAEMRRSIAETGTAWSRQIGGAVPDNTVQGRLSKTGLRQGQGVRASIRIDKSLPVDYTLCIKHPAAFSALLPELGRRFRTYAVVRNPLSVLASWSSVNMPHGTGHAPAAEDLDAGLRNALAGIGEVMERQLHLVDWYFTRYRDGLADGHVLRYEDIVASGGAALAKVAPSAAALREPLMEKNANKLYSPGKVRELADRLLTRQGAYWDFYSRAEVEGLRRAILA